MTREEAIKMVQAHKFPIPMEEWQRLNNEAIDMAISALEKPNYETDNEVRLAVVDRHKDKVVLWDAFGEVEYLPSDLLTHEEAWAEIERGDAETNPIPTGTGVMIQSPNNGADLISRADAIEAVMNTEPVVFDSQSLEPHQKTKDVIDALSALPSAELPNLKQEFESADRPTHDCTNLIQWLLEAAMDEEDWRENADAYGEIICRKLKKLGLLDTKDGYYIRTPLAYDDRPSGEWIVKDDDLVCDQCGESAPIHHVICNGTVGIQDFSNYCPSCGAKMKGGEEDTDSLTCKDCTHWFADGSDHAGWGMCNVHDSEWEKTGYCSYAERK